MRSAPVAHLPTKLRRGQCSAAVGQAAPLASDLAIERVHDAPERDGPRASTPGLRGSTARQGFHRPPRSPRRVGLLSYVFAAVSALWLIPETHASPPSSSSKAQNNYYRFVDDDGRVHISNVRRGKGDWKLWKSFVGSGGEGARGAPVYRDPVALQGDRYHRYDSYIRGAALRYQLPEALVRAVIHTESNYYPYARSRVGAMGLMQLMPSTAEYLGVTDAWDPRQNIYGGAKFLRLLANRFNGDMVLVLAGYHAGAGAVQKYGGVPPYETTRAYVKAVLRRYYAYERQAQVVSGTRRRGPARNIAE